MMLTWELSLVLLVFLLILRFLKQLWTCRHLPPGPLPLPLIGSMWRTGFKLCEDSLSELAKQYGNIYTVWIGHHPVVILSGYQTVKEGLIKYSEEFSGRLVINFFKMALKRRGLVLSNGRTWKQHRRFSVVTMRKLGLGKKGMERQIEEEAHWLVETFARANGQPLDPLLPITNAVSTMICMLSFGYRFSLEDEKFQKLIDAVDYVLKFGGSPFHALLELFPWLMLHLPGPHQKALSSTQLVLSFAKTEIEKHKECLTIHEPQDFTDFYLLQIEKSKGDPTSTYNEENLSECIFDLFVAGTETTATALQWALLLMVAYPDIQDKVHKEIDDVLGSPHSICFQDRKRLPYTNAVIHEVLRVKYALPIGIPRRSVKDVNMHGFIIPKNTIIVTDLCSVLHDPKQWENPKEFNPQNFLDKDGNFMAREEFLPFGAGHRVCLGEQMAKMELFFFFTKLLRAFRLQLPEGVTEKELKIEPVMGLSFHPYPFKLCAVPRCGTSSST
ncbi:cytochrome P450 2J5-like [Elgaria multicarinata webbii]|uniref:cytochrome P450 2J5-like n=1 Tax=Elgaria multicarinata webbii TaxID=159646 RepID=UPI002FCCE64A